MNLSLITHNLFFLLVSLLGFHNIMAFRFPLRNVVVFDGVCNFCNGWVDLILRYDTTKKVKFAAGQTEKGKQLLTLIGKRSDDLTSVVYIRHFESPSFPNGQKEVYVKSEAVLRVLEDVGVPKIAVEGILLTIPEKFRDSIYNIVAENRYNIMGKRAVCRRIDSDI